MNFSKVCVLAITTISMFSGAFPLCYHEMINQKIHKKGITCLKWHPQNPFLLASGSWDGAVSKIDIKTARTQLRYLHQKPVRSICWDTYSPQLFSAGDDGCVKVWHPDHLAESQLRKTTHTLYKTNIQKPVNIISLSPMTRDLAMVCADELIILDMGQMRTRRFPVTHLMYQSFDWHPTNRKVLAATLSGHHIPRNICGYNTSLLTLPINGQSKICWNPNKENQLAVKYRNKVRIFDVDIHNQRNRLDWSRGFVVELINEHKISDCLWNPRLEHILFTAHKNGMIHVWNTQQGKHIMEIPCHQVQCLACSDQNPFLLAAGTTNGRIVVYELFHEELETQLVFDDIHEIERLSFSQMLYDFAILSLHDRELTGPGSFLLSGQ